MLKRIYRASIITIILLFAFGLVLIFNSEGFIKSISTIIGIILLVIGILPVVDFFRYRRDTAISGISLISGIFSIVCGLMFLLNENMLMILIPVFIGVWMIINGINKFQFAFQLKDQEEKSWIITFIFSIIIIVCGAYFILNPIRGAKLVSQTLGIIICIYAVLDIIDCILIKLKYKEITTEITKVIDEQ
ncbi:MAG: DUF308 domain-containing protein [Bacilli bacterium]|nr:DUF308 domain-containing protein [Bacilli bacterium]